MQPMVGRADLLRAIAAGVDPDGAAAACGLERRAADNLRTEFCRACGGIGERPSHDGYAKCLVCKGTGYTDGPEFEQREKAMTDTKQLDPYRTILVCRVDGREVGRKAAMSANASAWLQEMALHYGRDGKSMTVDYEADESAGLLAAMGL